MNNQLQDLSDTCGIQYTMQPVALAPRDVTADLDHAEIHYLVTLTRPGTDGSVRVVFAKPLTDAGEPAPGEVLWWLAGDAFTMEQCGGKKESWANILGLPAEADGTTRLFDQQREQCHALLALLGEVGYRRLVTIYETEMIESSR